MAFTQLDPPLPVYVTDRGSGMAFAVIDYGPEFDLLWATGMDDGGEIWCVPNPQMRLQANWSLGRRKNTRRNLRHSQLSQSKSLRRAGRTWPKADRRL